MTDLNPLCVARVELGAHLSGGAQQALYLLGKLPNTEFRSMLVCPERNVRAVINREGK